MLNIPAIFVQFKNQTISVMKKILAVLLALYLIVPASFAQDDEIRPAAIGVSFILNDFTTAQSYSFYITYPTF